MRNEPVHQQSPLADFRQFPFTAGLATAPVISLVEQPFLQMLGLRGSPSDPSLLAAIEGALGFPLPVVPNTCTGGRAHVAMWMGPDEWLLQSLRAHATPELPAQLQAELASSFASVIDISSGYTVIDITGHRAADVLAKGCPLDLHPTAFRIGSCAQTRLYDAAVILRRTGAGIAVTVRRSFSLYLAALLVDACQEFS